ncbi:MAG: sodium:solute symporter, partial [Acidobacteriota bacterium]
LTRSVSDGIRLFATALVLAVVTGISDIWTVVIIGVVTIVYTFFGGMTAVVWNDFIQLVIYVGGALLAFWFVLDRVPGGWGEVVSTAAPDGKLDFLNLNLNLTEPYTILAGLIGGAFLTFATHGTDQMMVQRYLACGDRKKSQLALLVSGVIVALQFLLFLLLGVLLFAYYKHFPLQNELGHVNEILPTFIVQEMPPGVSGFIVAAIFAAAMSTLSSSLNSLSSSSLNDFYRARFVKGRSESHYLAASRVLTLIWGILLILVAVFARTQTDEVLQATLTITSIPMGSMLGIFLLGTFHRRMTQTPGLLGMTAGLIVMIGVSQFTTIAWTWYVLIGTLCTVSAGLIAQRFSR